MKDKGHYNFNIWTACATLVELLEKTQNVSLGTGPDVLILDRGLFDALVWMSMMEKRAGLRKHEREIIEKFLTIDDWRKRISGVIVMKTSADDAMQRESGHLPVFGQGSIMNPDTIQQMIANLNQCVNRFRNQFNFYELDTASTTGSNARETAQKAADFVLSIIEGEIEEEILSVDRDEFVSLLNGRRVLSLSEVEELEKLYSNRGTYGSREVIEPDLNRIQALPVVVIRNKSGQVLQLKRREENPKSPLHEKLVIWAGGHVRKEDSANGNTLRKCATRELQEELRLRVEPEALKLIGAVYDDSTVGLSKHVALVYQWQADSDDVNVRLNSVEFFERRGPSQSGRFIGLSDLLKCIDESQVAETWSVSIATELLKDAPLAEQPQPNLF